MRALCAVMSHKGANMARLERLVEIAKCSRNVVLTTMCGGRRVRSTGTTRRLRTGTQEKGRVIGHEVSIGVGSGDNAFPTQRDCQQAQGGTADRRFACHGRGDSPTSKCSQLHYQLYLFLPSGHVGEVVRHCRYSFPQLSDVAIFRLETGRRDQWSPLGQPRLVVGVC